MNKAGTQKIETQRLILRRFKIEDAEDMFNNGASDPEVNKKFEEGTTEYLVMLERV